MTFQEIHLAIPVWLNHHQLCCRYVKNPSVVLLLRSWWRPTFSIHWSKCTFSPRCNLATYLFKFQNVFVEISNHICWNFKMYLFNFQLMEINLQYPQKQMHFPTESNLTIPKWASNPGEWRPAQTDEQLKLISLHFFEIDFFAVLQLISTQLHIIC